MGKQKKAKPLHPEIQALIFMAIALLSLFALWSFSFLHPKENWLGYVGYTLSLGSHYLFGLGSYLFPAYLFWLAARALKKEKPEPQDHLFFALFLFSICILLTVVAEKVPQLASLFGSHVISETITLYKPGPHTISRYNLGGVPAYFLFADLPLFNFEKILSPIGTTLIFSTSALISFLLLTHIRLWTHFKRGKELLVASINALRFRTSSKPASPPVTKLKINLPEETPPPKEMSPPPIKVILPLQKREKKEEIPIPTKQLIVKSDGKYKLPVSDLLSAPSHPIDSPTLKKDLLHQAAILEETLKSFGIEAKVGEINSGPTITSFEVHPSVGVKVQKIKALENDIALNMQAKSIRIVAPIPGKAAVGVEIPALQPQEVNFREMLSAYQKGNRKLQIPILLGKAINGEWVFSDLAKMPHLLIAGATGSGKSVCVNTIVMSILMNGRPDEIKLLMIDPKKVELTQYSKLPHMIAPVITEPQGAYAALQWLVKEMQVRYEILKQLGLRNISAFNHRKPNADLEASLHIPIPEQMPMIVAIVDEFADLMMVSSADLETPIARIAQMARAVGIHLILATQRPSREVITGIIKANIPTRISFKVASRVNSQIILDETGAENLLGNGDLLFLPPGTSQLTRAQGAYISDKDIHTIIQAIEQTSPPNYLIPSFDAFRSLEALGNESGDEGSDTLYEQALATVLGSKSASTTYLQRKLKIGYARAASLMDALERNGIIGPQEGAKPRQVLAKPSEESDD